MSGFSLDSYRLLGRSGLRVSPLSLGTMTFGTDYGWGMEKSEAQRVFDTYVDRGGNFLDTAVNYTRGTSERFIGEFSRGKREKLVIATKYSSITDPDDPNSGGNHRLNMVRSVERSLNQLATDRIDLFYLHIWDATTGADEIMRGLDDLVRSGKVVYVAISDTPAWRVAQMQTLADLRGWAPLIALQIEYSLIQRTGEHELIPMAEALGLGVIPWSPLAGGVLTGKYTAADLPGDDVNPAERPGSRMALIRTLGGLSERSLHIVDVVRKIAEEIGTTPARVALAWLLRNPAVTAPIVGARTAAQLEDNLAALDVVLNPEALARLDEVSAPDPIFPNNILNTPGVQKSFFGSVGRPHQRVRALDWS